MKKIKLLLGNITFDNFSKEQKELFILDSQFEQKALIHELKGVIECASYEEAEKLGEHLISEFSTQFDSYLIPSNFYGEMVLEKRLELNVKEIFA